MTTQKIAVSKIIAFVIFISAAIITSLFVFHMSHQPQKSSFSDEYGTMFPAARELKEFKLVSGNQKFTQENLPHHWTLLFFGFTHCASVCPTTLDMMQKAYANLQSRYPNLQVVLVSLDTERDTPESVQQYAQGFNSNFIGTIGKLQEVRKLQSQFGVFSAKDPASGSNFQLQHTANIMLINPEGKWAGLFRFGLSPQQFEQGFTAAVRL